MIYTYIPYQKKTIPIPRPIIGIQEKERKINIYKYDMFTRVRNTTKCLSCN